MEYVSQENANQIKQKIVELETTIICYEPGMKLYESDVEKIRKDLIDKEETLKRITEYYDSKKKQLEMYKVELLDIEYILKSKGETK
jgi:hypothetical protein